MESQEEKLCPEQVVIPIENRKKPRLTPILKSRCTLRSFDSEEEVDEPHLDWKDAGAGARIDAQAEEKSKTGTAERLLKSSWMKGVSQDMFQPRQVHFTFRYSLFLKFFQAQNPDLDPLETSSQLDVTDDMSSQGYPLVQGLGQAIIEDYYPGDTLVIPYPMASRSQRQQFSRV